ncbi:MAG TPA: methionyl-tRNA formyltransferase [Rhabdochlamydiaceae bacterium]
MKIVFFGTSPFAAQILTFLLSQTIEVLAVVTRPDRPRGRSQQLSSPPVKETLLQLRPDIPVHQPEKASTPEFADILSTYGADLFVVVAYGEIIKQNILDIPKWGCINIHASLLPKYRGAAPIQRSLFAGDPFTGITIIDMVLKMDAGDMLGTAQVAVPPSMTCGELEEKLIAASCPLLLNILHDFENGTVKRISQDPEGVTFAQKITPEDEKIYWTESAADLHNRIRALSPAPGAWCRVWVGDEEKRLKIKRSAPVLTKNGTPGEILVFDAKEGLQVGCGQGALALLEVQLEGKKTMKIEDFIKGIRSSISFN